MNYRLIRFFDYHLGRLLCFFLGIFKRKRRFPSSPKKILLIRFWGIGSTIVATPAIRALKEKFPDAEISLLTMHKNKGVYDNSVLFDKIIYFKMKNITRTIAFTPLLIARLRNCYDLAIDLEFFSRYSALVSFFLNCYTIGFSYKMQGRKRLFDAVKEISDDENRRITFVGLIEKTGAKTSSYRLEKIRCMQDEKSALIQLVADKLEISSGTMLKLVKQKKLKIAVINPNAGEFAEQRIWPTENFAKLCIKLIRNKKAGLIVIAGGKQDASRALQIVSAVKKKLNEDEKKNIVSFAGLISIRQFAYLLELSSVFITNDTGPMHIGFAMGSNVVALFGPESPLRYGPVVENNVAVIYKGLSCSPCINLKSQNLTFCKDNKCMKNISLKEVYDASLAFLKAKKKTNNKKTN